MDIPTVRPPALRPGDTIGIIAPAGPIDQRENFYQGIATLERLGFRTAFTDRIFQSDRYLAGSDADRAEEMMHCFEDPQIRAVIALRGGYGCARLIPLLEGKRLRAHCKLFVGFSDLTTLHLFLRRRLGWVTFHGPTAASSTLGNIREDEEKHLVSLLTDTGYRPQLSFPQMESWFPGKAEGRLTGGCLSLVVSSLGTPYEIKTEGAILFLEDLGEPIYRIDRMLTQLFLAGKLNSAAGFLLGRFQDCGPVKEKYSVEEVLREMLVRLKVPVIANFPAGHGPDNWALPLGVRVRIDGDSPSVEFLEPAVVR